MVFKITDSSLSFWHVSVQGKRNDPLTDSVMTCTFWCGLKTSPINGTDLLKMFKLEIQLVFEKYSDLLQGCFRWFTLTLTVSDTWIRRVRWGQSILSASLSYFETGFRLTSFPWASHFHTGECLNWNWNDEGREREREGKDLEFLSRKGKEC